MRTNRFRYQVATR